MPKMKTNKAVRKRFKVTKTGKVMALSAKRRHLLTDRSPKSKQQARGWHHVDESDIHRFKRLLPYGE